MWKMEYNKKVSVDEMVEHAWAGREGGEQEHDLSLGPNLDDGTLNKCGVDDVEKGPRRGGNNEQGLNGEVQSNL